MFRQACARLRVRVPCAAITQPGRHSRRVPSPSPLTCALGRRAYSSPAAQDAPKRSAWPKVLGVLSVAAGAGVAVLGAAPEEGLEDAHRDEVPGIAHVKRIMDQYDEWDQSRNEPYSDRLLPDPLPPPYMRPYTLVLDLEETLIHFEYNQKSHLMVPKMRPGLKFFLDYVQNYYEIVIYTSGYGNAMSGVIDSIDPTMPQMATISYRLYRDANRYVDGVYVKDVKSLNRDAKKVVVVDDNIAECQLDKENCIVIKPWKGDPEDRELLDLIPLLESIAASNIDDVREVISRYEGQDMIQAFKENRERMARQAEEAQRQLQQQQTTQPNRRGLWR